MEVLRQRGINAKVGECLFDDLIVAASGCARHAACQGSDGSDRFKGNVRQGAALCTAIDAGTGRSHPVLRRFAPDLRLYGVEDEISRALNKEVPLKSGGYLVFDQTEAMTSVDINTGSFLGQKNLEETAYRTNLEAAQAVARQLRLRNLGGIIVIDFIDMHEDEHKRQVLRTLEKGLAGDHVKTVVYDFSPLGLVEMTRKRTIESLQRQLCEPCPSCNGRGYIKTAETVIYEIFREVTRAVRQFEAEKVMVMASPIVVAKITDEESAAVAELEEFINKDIRFQADEQYGQDQFDVVLS